MRRKDREVTDISEIIDIINICKVCHVAMVDNGQPYVVPLNFGYEIEGRKLTIFFHCAKEGRKLDILNNNNLICFEMCVEGQAVNAENDPCNSGYDFTSVIGNGKAEFVYDSKEKCKALTLILKQVTNLNKSFTKEQADTVFIFKVVTEDFTAKKKLRPANIQK